jgi:2-methylcitrate dehydratase PrpD
MSATEELIQYAAKFNYNDLDPKTIAAFKIHILDTCGAIVAGSSADGVKNLGKLLKSWGGREDATLLVLGDRLPAPEAAWFNATASRGFDYETLLMGGATHVTASILPAAFALAEYKKSIMKKPVSGKELIAALAVGCDLNWRFRVAGGKATIMAGGWLAETFAPPAIGAMGGILLDLDEEEINAAMSIGYNQCSGNYGASNGQGAGLMAQLSQGMGSRAGVVSTILAANGFSAYKEMIDGRWGLYHMYGKGEYDRDILLGGLGTRFEALVPTVKRFPGCGATQPVVSAALSIASEAGLRGEDVSDVRIRVDESSYQQCGENKGRPLNTAEALWNFRYSTAVALIKGQVFVDDFSVEAIADRVTLDLVDRITVLVDKSLKSQEVHMAMTTRSGRTFEKKETGLNPLQGAEIVRKFRDCWSFSEKPLSPENIDRFIETVEKLEEVSDIDELIYLIT